MRVLLLSQSYPPIAGGVEAHVSGLARGLARRGHDVAVATFSAEKGLGDARPDGEGVTVVRVGGLAQRIGALHSTSRRHAPPVPDPETVRDLRALARSFRPHVVHAHDWLGRSFLPIKRESGAELLVTLHDCGRTCAQGRMMFGGATLCEGPAARRCATCVRRYYGELKGPVTLAGNETWRAAETRAADLYLPVSRAIAEANGLGRDGARFEVVSNFARDVRGVPAPRGDDARLAELPAEPFVLQVGDMVSDKGVGVLFAAYARLDAPPPLVLLGRRHRDLPAARPEGVTLAGPWPPELVAEAWRRSLFGTIPSLCLDASPTVTMEAMSASRPVVASARGGLLDQIADGETGLLVPPGDAPALAAAMTRLVGDATLRESMGEAARRRYDQAFSAEVIVGRVEALYSEVAAATSATIGR